jgi:type III pantothenate kinase
LKNAYSTPGTLGADRLANVVAAAKYFHERAVLVIDLGTCITYDLLERDGTYKGGAISPGLHMRAKALHAYSARLPEVDPPEGTAPLGTTTTGALEAGIQHGILGELREFIGIHGKERPDMAVVLTGGDGSRFARALESGIFAIPFLTLEGYHALLEYHRSLHRGAGPAGPGRAVGAG